MYNIHTSKNIHCKYVSYIQNQNHGDSYMKHDFQYQVMWLGSPYTLKIVIILKSDFILVISIVPKIYKCNIHSQSQ